MSDEKQMFGLSPEAIEEMTDLIMVLHGNTSQALNNLNDSRYSSASIKHINEAIVRVKVEAQRQKFLYRKAKAMVIARQSNAIDVLQDVTGNDPAIAELKRQAMEISCQATHKKLNMGFVYDQFQKTGDIYLL